MNRGDLCLPLAVKSGIESGGRRVLASPLWVGLAISAFLVAPTFLVPSVPLWVALVSLVTLTPLVLLGTYAVYHLYRWAIGAGGNEGGNENGSHRRTTSRRSRFFVVDTRPARSTSRPSGESSTGFLRTELEPLEGRGLS